MLLENDLLSLSPIPVLPSTCGILLADHVQDGGEGAPEVGGK